jgi:uncharacterized membrane protein YccF (DUF307 family)
MYFALNLLWFVFGGWLAAALWFLLGAIMFLTVSRSGTEHSE